MAKVFNFTPSQVDEITYEQVLNMMHLNNEWVKIENEEVGSRAKR